MPRDGCQQPVRSPFQAEGAAPVTGRHGGTFADSGRVTFNYPGGAGFGDPLNRDPPRVLEDVREGRVSVESAQCDYRVVVPDGVVDEVATRRLRG